MKKSEKILFAVIAIVVAMVAVVFFVKRRGRKVYLKDYYLNKGNVPFNRVFIHPQNDWVNGSHYYDSTLKYVVLPFNADTVLEDGREYVEVKAIGYELVDGRIVKANLKEKSYIEKDTLNI